MNFNVELISIGDELLAGYTVNTNATYLSQKLRSIGFGVKWITTISDTAGEILNALETAERRASLVVVTGGLGPTPDDITKNTICHFFGRKLIHDETVLQNIKKLFARRGRTLLESNKAQALVPEGALVLQNAHGTAPGLLLQKNNSWFCFMPGVPLEMKALTEPLFLNFLKKEFKTPPVHTRLLRTTGIAESLLLEMLKEHIEAHPHYPFAFLPRHIGVDLRFKLQSQNEEEIQKWNRFVESIAEKAQKYIFSDGQQELQEVVLKILREKKLTLALAESFTGGLTADWLTDIPGCSDVLQGSLVAYANDVKASLLDVPESVLQEHGAVSEQTALFMVRGAQKRFNTDCAIATTGIAGPTGGSADKPVGLAFVAAAFHDKTVVKKFNLGNDRKIIKMRGAMTGLEMLRRLLLDIK